jgi:hypothetical protein
MKKIFFLLLTALATQFAFGQCDRFHFSSYCRIKPSESKGMVLSSQSKSGLLEANKTYSFQVVLFGNMDYKLIFCTQGEFSPVHFVISERESGQVYYDNQEDEYIESIGLTTDNTMTFIFQVTLLAEGTEFKDFNQNRGCIGMPIMYRRVPKMGL